MPSVPLDAADAIELAELLCFLGDWLESDRGNLTVSLARFTSSTAYGPASLREDIARFRFLLGTTDGQGLFSPDEPQLPALRKSGPLAAWPASVAVMADNADISLVGFKGFTASERFLRALDDEIWVARQNPETGLTDIVVRRPEGIESGGAMRAELERPSHVTVISAHAGYWGDLLGFCGDGDQPVLKLDSQLGTLGATGMVLIDACYGPELAAELKTHGQAGAVIAYLDYGSGKKQITWGKDSVTVIGSVIRELCYTVRPGLSPEAATRAVNIVNAQSDCRKQVQRPRLRML